MEASTADRVVVKCKNCLGQYEMRKKDLAKVASQNRGWVPCRFCGNWNTTWDLQCENSGDVSDGR